MGLPSHAMPSSSAQPRAGVGAVFAGEAISTQRWGVDSVQLAEAPPPPPPLPPGMVLGTASVDSPLVSAATHERVKVLVGQGADLAAQAASGSVVLAKQVPSHPPTLPPSYSPTRRHAGIPTLYTPTPLPANSASARCPPMQAASGGAVLAAHAASSSAQLAQQASLAVQASAGLTAEDVELLGVGLGVAGGVCCLCCLRCLYSYCTQPARKSRGARGRFDARRRRRSHRALPVDDYSDDDDDDDDEYIYDP